MKKIALAIVNKNGKYLVQKRYRRNIGMVYEFPGGSVDENETFEQAGIRELYEETGLKLNKVIKIDIFRNELNWKIGFVQLIASENDEPKIIEKARKQEFYWFKPSEIPVEGFHEIDKKYIDTLKY